MLAEEDEGVRRAPVEHLMNSMDPAERPAEKVPYEKEQESK
jgi:hypothetical protein